MRELHVVVAERTAKVEAMKKIMALTEADKRPLTAAEVTEFDKLKEGVATLDAEIAAIKESQKRAQALATITSSIEQQGGRVTAPTEPGTVHAGDRPLPAMPRRYSARPEAQLYANDHAAYRMGRWIRGFLLGSEHDKNWCASNGVRAAMTEGSNSAGGVLVPDELSTAIIDQRDRFGVIRRECQVVPMGSDTMTTARIRGGVTVGPVGEGGTISKSDPALDVVKLSVKKFGGSTLLSSELAEDAYVEIATMLAQEFGLAFARFEDQCGFTGDGTSAFAGITGLAALFTTAAALKGMVEAPAGIDTFEEITAVHLARVMAALPEWAAQTGSVKWFCSRPCAELVFGRVKQTAGGNDGNNLSAGFPKTYAGYDIVTSPVLPSSTGAINGTPFLYFGSLAAAVMMGSRRGITMKQDASRYIETDQLLVVGTERVDIVVHGTGDATNAGAIVSLNGKT